MIFTLAPPQQQAQPSWKHNKASHYHLLIIAFLFLSSCWDAKAGSITDCMNPSILDTIILETIFPYHNTQHRWWIDFPIIRLLISIYNVLINDETKVSIQMRKELLLSMKKATSLIPNQNYVTANWFIINLRQVTDSPPQILLLFQLFQKQLLHLSC